MLPHSPASHVSVPAAKPLVDNTPLNRVGIVNYESATTPPPKPYAAERAAERNAQLNDLASAFLMLCAAFVLFLLLLTAVCSIGG